MEERDRIANGKKSAVAALSVASNATLVTVKLIIGLMVGSVSVISEAIHSGIDLLAAVIAFFAVRAAGRPADQDHPFGHGKYENVSGTIEAVLIFLAAALIINEAVKKLLHGGEIEQVSLGLAAMGLSVVLNIIVSRKLMIVARETDSVALEADALHLKTDVYTSLGVFIGLGLITLTGYSIIDPIAAILVALLIIKEAWVLTRRAFGGVLDVSLSPEELDEVRTIIRDTISSHPADCVTFHDLRTRKSGSDRQIDLHLEVSPDLPVGEAHRICDEIEQKISARYRSTVTVIHVEPRGGKTAC